MSSSDDGGAADGGRHRRVFGIGHAIAVALGGLGWQVAIGARRVEQLAATAQLVIDAGGSAIVHPLDVTDAISIDGFLLAAAAAGPVDVLINNAGTAQPGPIHELPDGVHRRIVETNLLGPILMTQRVVAELREGHQPGDIVFISSDVTVHPRPHMATYRATKAGLEAFASTLALEGEGFGIRSAVVRVGPTATSFGDGWDPKIFTDLFPIWQRFGTQRHFNTLQPDDVARAVVSVVTAPPHTWMPVVEVQPNPPVA